MTAIAIWLNEEDAIRPALWVAADSLITKAGDHRLIGDAAKIMPLHVVCRRPNAQGFFSELASDHSYGYAFAGSTLIGQNVYLSLVPLLGSLNVRAEDSQCPSLSEIADYILRYLRASYEDFRVSLGEQSQFCIAVFGWCPVARAVEIYKFQLTLNTAGQYEVACEGTTNFSDTQFVYLGDCSEQISAKIALALKRDRLTGNSLTRAPKLVIEECIAADDCPTIGGDLQLAIANASGFQPFLICRPRVAGEPAAYFSYLGRELTEDLSRLGSAQVFFPAMP